MKKLLLLILSVFLCAAVLTACNQPSKTETGSSTSAVTQPVEAFYDAIVTQNRDRVSSITCSSWERNALRDVDSFMGVKSELKDFSCKVESEGTDEATVVCTGVIAASYGAEITEFPLAGRTHKVIREQGEWRFCGY